MPQYKLAILDDYQGIAAAKFKQIASQLQIEEFQQTLNVSDPTQKEDLIRRLQPFDIICTMRERTRFTADVIHALPNLKLLTTTGMRNAAIDMEACRKAEVIVVGAKGTVMTPAGPKDGSDSTTEHAWALILGLARKVAQNHQSVQKGGWQTGFAFGLKRKTLGVLGFGHLGQDTSRVALAFGMNVLAWSSSLTQGKADAAVEDSGIKEGTIEVVSSKKELFERADIVSVHYVLSDRSRGIVGKEELAVMKPTALLVNTSRGPLIDDDALYEVLVQRRIAGFASDVFDAEPLPKDSRWREADWSHGDGDRSMLLLSPHMGYVEEDVMNKWYEETAVNVQAWLEGRRLETQIV